MTLTKKTLICWAVNMLLRMYALIVTTHALTRPNCFYSLYSRMFIRYKKMETCVNNLFNLRFTPAAAKFILLRQVWFLKPASVSSAGRRHFFGLRCLQVVARKSILFGGKQLFHHWIEKQKHELLESSLFPAEWCSDRESNSEHGAQEESNAPVATQVAWQHQQDIQLYKFIKAITHHHL